MGPERQATAPTEVGAFGGRAEASRYDRESNRRFYRRGVMRLLEGKPALAGLGVDLGCGTGISTEALIEAVPEVRWKGVDVAPAMLTLARQKSALAGNVFEHARAEALPFADGSIDVIVANFAWHWFRAEAGAEVRRVLRPGGWLLGTVPLRRPSRVDGNRALARALLTGRRNFARLRSQGMVFDEVRSILPGRVRVARHELCVERERFRDGRELLDVLDSRGALAAVFGEHPPSHIEAGSPVEFEWPFAVVHLQAQ